MQLLSSRFAPRTLLGLALAFTAAHSVHAQLLSTGLPGQRTFGDRYVEVSAAIVEPHSTGLDHNGQEYALAANVPANGNIDFGFAFATGSIRPTGARLTDDIASATVVAHPAGPGLKPFFGATLGYDWTDTKVGPLDASESSGLWALGIGVQIPIQRVTLTLGWTHGDAFRRGSTGASHVNAEVATWFTSQLGGYAEATYTEFTRDRGRTWTYRAGLRWKL